MRTKLISAALSVALCVALGACSSGSNLPPPSRLPANPHEVRLAQVWSRDAGGGGGDQLLGLAPSAHRGDVFVAASNGWVTAFAVSNGKRVWSRHVKHGRLSGGPAVGEGTVVVGDRNGYVVALNSRTGRVEWTSFVGAPVLSNPVVAPGVVAVKTIAGGLVGLDLKTGARLWAISEQAPSLTLRYGSVPLIVKGTVYAGFSDGKVLAVNASTGKILWRTQVAVGRGANQIANLVDVGGLLGYAAGDLYAVTYQGRLAALNASSGQIVWTQLLSSFTGLTLTASRIYVSDSDGRVHAFDLVTGVPDWVYSKLEYRGLSAPVPFHHVIVVGDRFGWLHVLSGAKGRYLGRVKVGGSAIRMPPIVVGQRLVVLTNGGSLSAYRMTVLKKQSSSTH